MAGNYNHVMKKPWKGHKPPALESFPSIESSDSGPPALVSSSMSFRHLLSRPLIEAPCDPSYPPSVSAISRAPLISHRPISVHVFTEDAREYGSHARQGMSADGGCVRATHATFQSDGASDGASDVFAFSAQRKSSQPLIDINHPPSALYDSTSQDSSQAPATPAASDGSKPVVSHGVNMFFVRDDVADASHGLATATAARTHPAPVPVNAVSGPRPPAPRSAIPHSLRLPSAATSSNSDCGYPEGEGPEEGEVCDNSRRAHVGKKVCLRHEEQQLWNKVDEDDVVLGAELLVSLFGSCPV
ncbi:unnamed protein product [Closterium sp. Naga37s-1]|nr:unnamed protein product [Closterium sp. Naga37s-1]